MFQYIAGAGRTSVNPGSTAVFTHVNLKLLFRPLQFPLLVAPYEIAGIKLWKPQAQVEVAEEHAAQMRYIADAAGRTAERAHECDRANDHHEVFGFDRK